MRTLIAGCGYIGVALGTELIRQGHEVWGLRRDPGANAELEKAGIKPLNGDLTDPASLQALPNEFDWVVDTVSSTKGGVTEYEQVYLAGARHLLAWVKVGKKLVYTSSTSVYGQTDGSVVKETSPTEPLSPTSRILVATEKVFRDAAPAVPTVILRVAGIYGPERGHLFQQYLKNEARISGKGERIINMIHQADVVGAIIAALRNGRPGEVYNVVDDEPVTQLSFFRWLSETLGKYMPPFETVAAGVPSKRGSTQKKVSNRRLRMELGYQLAYPTFRQGYTAEILRLDRAGLLEITPEPR